MARDGNVRTATSVIPKVLGSLPKSARRNSTLCWPRTIEGTERTQTARKFLIDCWKTTALHCNRLQTIEAS